MSAPLRSRFALILLFVGALWLPLSALGQVPNPTGRVTDQAAVLSAEDNLVLAQMLANYERETTHQIGVLTVQAWLENQSRSFLSAQQRPGRLVARA